MIVTNFSTCCLLLVLFAVVTKSSSAKFTFGKEAEKLCEAYKKICPRGKVCAIQTIAWPRAMKFPVCVHQHIVHVRSRVCKQAPSPGGCGAQFRRWYYNVHTASCSWFTYGGCGGNDNNFRSREECESMCLTVSQEDGHTDDVTDTNNKRNEEFFPRHENRRHYSRGQVGGQADGNDGGDKHHLSRNHHHHNHGNRHHGLDGLTSNTNQDDVNGDVKSQLDVYKGSPYSFTTASPTTSPSWRSNEDENRSDNDKWRSDRDRVPLEHRRAPEELRKIRTKPRPQHRRQHTGRHRPAALSQKPTNPAAAYSLKHDDDATDFPDKRRRVMDIPGSKTGLIDFVNSGKRGKRVNANERLAGLAFRMPKVPTVSIRRRPIPGDLQPPRAVSLMSRREPLVVKGPVRALEKTDVTSGLTSSLASSYAADANETVRKFPKRRRRTKGKGQKKRNRRRRRKNRKRGRRYRKGKTTRYPATPRTVHHSHVNATDVDGRSNSTSGNSSNTDLAQRDPSGGFAEYRTAQSSFWPEKTQNDEAKQKDLMNTKQSQRKMQREDKKGRRRRRRRRRRKGKGRRRQRGGRRGRGQGKGEDLPPPDNQYYEKIRLFGLLESSENATDTTT